MNGISSNWAILPKKNSENLFCKHFVNMEKNEQSQANKHIYTYISQ